LGTSFRQNGRVPALNTPVKDMLFSSYKRVQHKVKTLKMYSKYIQHKAARFTLFFPVRITAKLRITSTYSEAIILVNKRWKNKIK